MTPAELSIRRPMFISCLVILMLILGWLSLKRIPVDLFPDVTLPTVVVRTTYPGAGPVEIETEVSKPIEEELSSISGIKTLKSTNREGLSIVVAEFNLNVDIKYAEQQVRAKFDNVKADLPLDIEPPAIWTLSPSDAPILAISLQANLPDGQLFDLADDYIRPQFEQVNQVAKVEILGGRKREIHVELDRQKLMGVEMSASQVAAALDEGGRNIPAGKTDKNTEEIVFRTMAEYSTVAEIKNSVLRSTLGGMAIPLSQVGDVHDTLEDEMSRTYLNGEKALVFEIYRQSGANSVRVAEDVKSRIEHINSLVKDRPGAPKLLVVNDRSRIIRANVDDVYESIFLGILLTVIVVYLFLGSVRSTIITGLALPNSLLGAFILMSAFGFTVNIMSLLALSIVVGLLVDDAIVVRENIYKKIEAGLPAREAATVGTNEVTLAVIATTLTVLAVFGPIGNLEGIVGQYFKQFGLTVCFAMAVSLFDALTVAPMLSAYFAGRSHKHAGPRSKFALWNERLLARFEKLQTWLEVNFERTLRQAMKRPLPTLAAGLGVFVFSIFLAKFVPVTFLPPQDNGEFIVRYDLPPGTNLDGTEKIGRIIDERLRTNRQVEATLMTIGSADSESNMGRFYVRLVPSHDRRENTSQMKDLVRKQLADLKQYNVQVSDADASGSNQRAFNMNIMGSDLEQIREISEKVLARARAYEGLKDADTSFRPGKPEVRVNVNPTQAQAYGLAVTKVGRELRTQVEGVKAAIYREGGRDYDVRVRMRPEQRDLYANLNQVFVPNLNDRPIRLMDVAKVEQTSGPAKVLRQNRTRYVEISADITPGGPGLGGAMRDLGNYVKDELKVPGDVTFAFTGQAERFAELIQNILYSLGLGALFIYLVLASLYESFIAPFTIMLVIPLAACGAFAALFITRASLDLYSMIGCVMLMGMATKNSILLIDSTQHLQKQGMDRLAAVIEAGRSRLRPILMTSLAMIAGMVPVAVGLNEASKQRTSLGIVVIGGTVSSTLLTLYIIPAAFLFIDRFQIWFYAWFDRTFRPELEESGA